MASQVFISYSQRDRAVAEAICAALEECGIPCWMAPRDIIPGEMWEAAIIQAIRNCKTMVLVFSSGSNNSPDVLQEVRQGHQRRIPIITFRVEDIEPSDALAYYLGARQWLDALTDRMEVYLQQLVNAVSAHLELPSGRHSGTVPEATRPQVRGAIPGENTEFRVAMSGSAKGLRWTGPDSVAVSALMWLEDGTA